MFQELHERRCKERRVSWLQKNVIILKRFHPPCNRGSAGSAPGAVSIDSLPAACPYAKVVVDKDDRHTSATSLGTNPLEGCDQLPGPGKHIRAAGKFKIVQNVDNQDCVRARYGNDLR